MIVFQIYSAYALGLLIITIIASGLVKIIRGLY